MKSENKNFILNVVFQILTYVFPLVTVTYISRVLGVSNLGIYSYTYSIVNMFMLVAMLGVNNYGNRAVSKSRDDKQQLSRVFCQIYYLQLIVSLVIIGIYVLYMLFICDKYKAISWIQLIFLVSVCFDINWFFFGTEKFKITIVRNLTIKMLSLAFIFVFVKQAGDLWKYTMIMAASTLFSQLYLIMNIGRYVSFIKVPLKEIFSHLKGVLVLFVPVIAFAIYRVMDKTMIGALSSVEELGYYENAERLISIPVALINALGTVMLPRMAYILKDEDVDYKTPIRSSMKLAMIMSTIMALGLMLISKEVVLVLFGIEFEKSAGILIALASTVIVSAWANVVRTQYLIPRELDNIYVASTILGAVVNLVFNLIFIRMYGAYGACIGTIVAELLVALYQTIRVRKALEIFKYCKQLVVSLAKSGISVLVAYYIARLIPVDNNFLLLVIKTIVAAGLFVCLNFNFIFNEFLGLNIFKRRRV